MVQNAYIYQRVLSLYWHSVAELGTAQRQQLRAEYTSQSQHWMLR